MFQLWLNQNGLQLEPQRATDTTTVIQTGAVEVILITKTAYSANAVGQNITIQGKSNSANLSIHPYDIMGNKITGISYKLAVAGVTDESWDGSKDITVDGDQVHLQYMTLLLL